MSNAIYTCLWFNQNAKAAADHYCRIFRSGKITSENPMVVMIELNGTKIMLLNGGPQYVHSPAASLVIECDNQEEIDHYWNELGKDGKYDRCGWLQDQFGVSWQIVPSILSKLMADSEKRERVVQAFLKMTKFDIQALLNA